MSDFKNPREVMRELLKLSSAERAKLKPADGAAEVAKCYLDKAIEERDGAMLKFIMELAEAEPKGATTQLTKEQKVSRFMELMNESVDE